MGERVGNTIGKILDISGSSPTGTIRNGAAYNAAGSGRPSLDNAQEVLDMLGGKLDDMKQGNPGQRTSAIIDEVGRLVAKGDIQALKNLSGGIDQLLEKGAAAARGNPLAAAGLAIAYAVKEIFMPTNVIDIVPVSKVTNLGKGALNALRKTNQAKSAAAAATSASRGFRVERRKSIFRGMHEEEISYTKRDRVEYNKLRAKFDSTERGKFLKEISNDPAKVKRLEKAGLTKEDIGKMRQGKVPGAKADEWEVHHKIPLDDGGTNSFDNLVLIKNDPYHKKLTRTQFESTKGLQVGETRTISLPVPNEFVYP
jgi:hypothetical protein